MSGQSNHDVLNKFALLYNEIFLHNGYGDIRVEMKILRRGQKEVIIHCGKQYRFVVDFEAATAASAVLKPPAVTKDVATAR